MRLNKKNALIDNNFAGSSIRSSVKIIIALAIALIILSACGYAYLPEAGAYLSLKPAVPKRADAIVILGGGWDERVITAEELLARGFAGTVLLTAAATTNKDDTRPLDHRYALLRRDGIPAESIYLDHTARSTWQDVRVIADHMERMGWRKVLIVSDPPHMRRLDWVCRQLLGKVGFEYELVPTRPRWWDETHWWRIGIAVEYVFQEYIKLAFYHIAYGGPFSAQFEPAIERTREFAHRAGLAARLDNPAPARNAG